jgi:hypothetical protein
MQREGIVIMCSDIVIGFVIICFIVCLIDVLCSIVFFAENSFPDRTRYGAAVSLIFNIFIVAWGAVILFG